jgi:cephalosporin hydroxylase
MAMITIDTENNTVTENGQVYPMESAEAFEIVSRAWLRAGWDVKYVYGFTWMGRPIIQLPEDMIRLQELIYRIQPDVIIETGVAHGGGLIFYASLCKAMGKGRVIGVDIEIRPHNRKAIEEHELFSYITLLEGDSAAVAIVNEVKSYIKPDDVVLVTLDSNHSKAHVTRELEAYSPLVSVGSYIVAMDGIMELVAGGPRTQQDWKDNNPRQAALEFTRQNPDFIIEEPSFIFNESMLEKYVTYFPDAFIKRLR